MFELKKIDAMLCKQLLPPLLLAFFLSIFVLAMNVIYLWIDELAGKGIGFWVFAEFIFYLLMTLIPQAIPVAILLSTVMVFGNLAESYQLASFKASGISLWRIMRAPMIIIFTLASFSAFNSSYLIPQAQLKFRKRLYEIKSKKPALAMKIGAFNTEFSGFAIWIRSKDKDGVGINGIKLYDMRQGSDKINTTIAKRGQMYTVEDRNLFVMKLYDGIQYQDHQGKGKSRRRSEKPFVRMAFDEMTMAFDLSDFDLKETNEELFSNQRYMLTSGQLRNELDSIDKKVLNVESFINKKLSYDNPMIGSSENLLTADSTKVKATMGTVFRQESSLQDTTSALYSFPVSLRSDLLSKTLNNLESLRNEANVNFNRLQSYRKEKVKATYELHSRFAFSLACLIFLFIGAPMGAIVRKGGFGFPMLIAIIFFVTFIMSTTALRKMAEGFTIGPVIAAWSVVFVMAGLSFFLTRMAMKDIKFNSLISIQNVSKHFKRKQKNLIDKSMAAE